MRLLGDLRGMVHAWTGPAGGVRVHLAAIMPPHPNDGSARADKLRIGAKGGLVRGHHRGKLGDKALVGPRVGLLRRELPAVVEPR